MPRHAATLFLILALGGCGSSAPAPPAPPAAPDLATALRRDSQGLVVERGIDGSQMVNLRGRFQNAPVAYRGADGKVTIGCADNLPAVQRALAGQAPRHATAQRKVDR